MIQDWRRAPGSSFSSCSSCPCSPDGKILVFLSSQAAVDSGAHSATNSLHSMIWPSGVTISPLKIENVVRRGPVYSAMCMSVGA